jgi:hypothetical protein
MLTLAKVPGTFVVPAGDEGGPMTNGANHPGYIHRGDQDQWTFTANAGDNINLSIGEAGADSQFAPWIRVFGPTGVFLGNGTFSQLGGKIDLTASVTGTYTVVVASADATYSAAGSYLLTLAKTGAPFVVPYWDEGGPMANGVVYPGTITRADLDQWAFVATAGSVLTVRADEVGPDSGFYPWIRLYAPNGTLLASQFGPVVAQIVNATAPSTGLYTVVVASADLTYTASGNYAIYANGIAAPPALDLGDIVVDFGASYGVWLYANQSGPSPQWQQLLNLSPTRMARGDIDGSGTVSLIATFQGLGVWIWRSATGWTQLHNLDATDIVTADLDGNGQDDIILNFPGAGLWARYNNTTWYQLHPLNPTALTAGNIDGDAGRKSDLIVTFPGYGVWTYQNNAAWSQIHPTDAFGFQAGDFDGNGQDDVVLNFAGQGIWIYANNGTWSQLHGQNSAVIAVGNIDGDPQNRKDIIISFAGYGVYAWKSNIGWTQLHSLESPVLATVDLDKNGKDDVILNFTGYGLWVWKNNASYEQLHSADIEGVAPGRYDIN